MNKVLVIVGPTASGKTTLSLLVAKQLNGEILSADSRQIYKFLDIGTAKPTKEQLREVKHYFIDELKPDEEFSAGEYGKRGRELIRRIFQKGKVPIVVGGSGLYIQSLVDGLFEGPSADNKVRKKLYDRLHRNGAESLLRELRKVDPVLAAKMLPSNTRRIVRALEVYELTGVPISQLQEKKIERNFVPLFVGLAWDRKRLYERINYRVDEMLAKGLIDEVNQLEQKGYTGCLSSLQTVGYEEAFAFLRGEIDYDKMVELIKRNSRQYAKRQLTWFRRNERVHWFKINDERDFSRVTEKIFHIYKFGNS